MCFVTSRTLVNISPRCVRDKKSTVKWENSHIPTERSLMLRFPQRAPDREYDGTESP